MRNAVIKDRADKERQRFINSIDTDAICRLVSSYAGLPCKTFGSPKHGSFNVCVFVEFETMRWAVRIPLPARAAWIDEKIETELATMRYVSAKTTIPVPRVHAYFFTKGSPIQTTFIIMDYVQGQTLKDLGFKKGKRWRSYSRLTESTLPPIWLTGGNPEWMLLNKGAFYTEVGRLIATIENREKALQAPPQLSREWAKMEKWYYMAVVIALLSPDLMHNIYWHFLFNEIEEAMPPGSKFRDFYLTAIAPRLTAFIEQPKRKALLARKEDEQRRFFEDEKEHFQNPYARQMIEEG
ncbi:hypothetical protein AK830_g6678 [Neonectria ditissima]|uniref:Uncharacterized protein n=1 Tax=Neonectria ditissima TaxID=78410 RepID=A0A0P7BHY9_9HYPO|nr:hypothetical protein AK830_g6678 [Neonectria ditissima]